LKFRFSIWDFRWAKLLNLGHFVAICSKTQKVKNPVLYLLYIVCEILKIISCDLAHQKRSICDDLLHDVRLKRDDRWKLTFFHGTRVCFFFFCSKVEMFSSSRENILLKTIILLLKGVQK
jgi:hypothetical protein